MTTTLNIRGKYPVISANSVPNKGIFKSNNFRQGGEPLQGFVPDGVRPDRGLQRVPGLPGIGVVLADAPPTGVRAHRGDQEAADLCCWGEGLTVWEVAQCYKRSFIMKRTKEESTGWEVSDPKLVAVCWSNEGQLYAVDATSNMYSLLKKSDQKWQAVWKYAPDDEVFRLVSNSLSDIAVLWTEKGFVYKLSGEGDDRVLVKFVDGNDVSFEASPVEPLLIVFGEVGRNYGMGLYTFNDAEGMKKVGSMCERIICIDMETGKDNKFTGKMAGPYMRLLPLSARDTAIGIPHLTTLLHPLRLSGEAVIDSNHTYVAHLAGNRTLVVHHLHGMREDLDKPPCHEPPSEDMFDEGLHTISIIGRNDKNYLDLQEDKRVREETMDYKKQREELVKNFEAIQTRVVALLEENIAEIPLHQLSLSEFNLHLENKKERMKQAEKERELIRLETEARIKAQDVVTQWIKKYCWDTMMTPRVKLLAIFSHYQVENYAVLPTQRDMWPELQLIAALRGVEMENDADLFRPWEEHMVTNVVPSGESIEGSPYVLSGSNAHKFIDIPPFIIPQTLAFSFLQMNWSQQITKLNVQNMRLWFNKQFDDLMAQKKREVGLVMERNSRLRFIVDELNKLSDLRGSFHHLSVGIYDPEWRQEEQPERLIKVDPEECSITPYISPSQVVVPPPEPKPKDDFRERALMEMMDGVLEKLWHEEIKKPIPPPQCMDDLRLVFDYEAKVAFRNEERDKYRKMLHAEYAKLTQVVNEGIVKFNQKVKEMWLTKLKVDSVIGQENLNLMRLRRVNLDRVEMAEKLEDMRENIHKTEKELERLQSELHQINEQAEECQSSYDGLAQRDRQLDKTFKNHFADLSPIIVEQCYKMRAVAQEMTYVESACNTWKNAVHARKVRIAQTNEDIRQHRDEVEFLARNKTIQLVLPAGQVEITTTGHFADFEDATLIRREDIESINNLILKVGDWKLRMMRKQMDFRKGILAKEWEHAQMKMKLRHMEQELYSYRRLKVPKELQYYLKNKELGYTDEQDYVRLEKEMEASKIKIDGVAAQAQQLEKFIVSLNVKASEKKLNEDPLEPIRIRRANHSTIVLLQTELELLRLKTYPTLASFRTID
ncbi:unnamed protein product [Leptidea sinapis]|uniref:Cilia- and flagella-associated protein 43 n=1 Tax=Leptidea sinapis TaxID=189913 RepID=A0A5E4QWE2_9NEOP|nr:unnamed protein product [Leptidea sinapis]